MPSIVWDNFSGGLDRRLDRSAAAANVLWLLTNCYITTGKRIRKRPCLTKIATLEAGTVGLRAAGGKLNTFYSQGTITHANALFLPRKCVHPTVPAQDLTRVHYAEMFNGYLYASVEYQDASVKHHYFDTSPTTVIADVNCPHGKLVRKLQQKIYSNDGANVDFCKTSDPRDWTAASDAGFIPSGIHAAGADTVTGLGDYKGDLGIFYADSLQVWDVDSDPANNALISTLDTIGTVHGESMESVANDLIFLAKPGFRSLSLVTLTDNLQENDPGSPIDQLRSEIADADVVMSLFYPALGQWWATKGTRSYVYSFSKSAKITAWSVFDWPVTVDAMAVLNNELYIRSGDDVYRVDGGSYLDDGMTPLCSVEMFFQDAKTPGINKQWMGFDAIVKGTPEIAWRFDPRNTDLITPYVPITKDTRPGDLMPMELMTTSVAAVVRHQANEEFELSLLQCYYENLGPV